MTRNATAQVRNLNVVRLFVAALTMMVALAALAQQIGKGELSGKSTASGNPLFLATVPYATGGIFSASVAVADVNNDGRQDLLVASENELGVLLGNGDGTFQPAVNFGPGGNSIAVADVNADGRPDLVVGSSFTGFNLDGSVNVLLGNGDGTFQSAVVYDSGARKARSVAIADLNGDGRPDIIVANCGFGTCFGRGSVGILLGNGDGTFQSVVTYDSGGYNAFSVALADVNRDNAIDIVAVNGCVDSSCTNGSSVAVLLGNENGTFATPLIYPLKGMTQEGATFAAVGDLNADGQPDIVVAGLDSGIGILLGNGDGSFQSPITYDTGGYPDMSVAVGDVNGDGIPDLVAAKRLDGNTTGLVNVLLGNGDGTFQSALSYVSGGFDAWSVAIGDLNGDGKPDVVAANLFMSFTNQNGTVGVLLNNTPSCTTPPVVTMSASPTSFWPPNGKMVPVTISGRITDLGTGCKLKSVGYAVKDEYGEVQPSGAVTMGPGGLYSLVVPLQASRLGSDLDGRQYFLSVSATNNSGQTGSQTGIIIVPHDQRR